jgi:hypothetical protein
MTTESTDAAAARLAALPRPLRHALLQFRRWLEAEQPATDLARLDEATLRRYWTVRASGTVY